MCSSHHLTTPKQTQSQYGLTEVQVAHHCSLCFKSTDHLLLMMENTQLLLIHTHGTRELAFSILKAQLVLDFHGPTLLKIKTKTICQYPKILLLPLKTGSENSLNIYQTIYTFQEKAMEVSMSLIFHGKFIRTTNSKYSDLSW